MPDTSFYVRNDDAASPAELMPEECISTALFPQLELQHEVLVMVLCCCLGFFTVRIMKLSARRTPRRLTEKLQSQAAVVCTPLAHSTTKLGGLAELPREIIADVARCLPLGDFASVSSASHGTWQRFGLSPEAWSLLAADHQVELLTGSKAGAAGTSNLGSTAVLQGEACFGRELREAFRRSIFHIHGQHQSNLCEQLVANGIEPDAAGGHAAVLSEAARVVLGLMPYDGVEAIELTCAAAERALQAHNPANKDASSAAASFMHVLHRRRDIINSVQAERLESAYSSALQLQALMDVAMEENLDDLETSSDGSVSPPDSPFSTSAMAAVERLSPHCMEHNGADAGLEDMHELQRHCELDALLEELRLQTEPTSVF